MALVTLLTGEGLVEAHLKKKKVKMKSKEGWRSMMTKSKRWQVNEYKGSIKLERERRMNSSLCGRKKNTH